jgi:protein-tyrosine phosphatase
MVAQGVMEAVVTPHVGHPGFDVDAREIAARTYLLGRELHRRDIPLRLRPGGEIHPAALDGLGTRELEMVAQGPAGARWVLAGPPLPMWASCGVRRRSAEGRLT